MMKNCENIDEKNINFAKLKKDFIKIIKYSPDHIKINIDNINSNNCFIVLNRTIPPRFTTKIYPNIF